MLSFRDKTNRQDTHAGTTVPLVRPADTGPAQSASTGETVIAHGIIFTGNLSAENANVLVYGEVCGNIRVCEGTVDIMEGGRIEGDICAPLIRINGMAEGVAEGGDIEIHSSGVLRGFRRSVSFSIREGGVFVGQSEQVMPDIPERVVALSTEIPRVSSDE